MVASTLKILSSVLYAPRKCQTNTCQYLHFWLPLKFNKIFPLCNNIFWRFLVGPRSNNQPLFSYRIFALFNYRNFLIKCDKDYIMEIVIANDFLGKKVVHPYYMPTASDRKSSQMIIEGISGTRVIH